MATPRTQALPALRARLHDALAERGLTMRQVVLRLPERAIPTVYRVLGGMTRDPLTSTLLALCGAIGADPDELLDARRPALEPEVEALLEEAEALDEADRRLLVDLLRAFARRQSSPWEGRDRADQPPQRLGVVSMSY